MTDENTKPEENEVAAEAVVENPTESPVDTTATAAATNPTATTAEENSTQAPVDAATNVAGSPEVASPLLADLDEVRKDAENEVHPVIKHCWDKFEGDAKAILIFVESELKKLF